MRSTTLAASASAWSLRLVWQMMGEFVILVASKTALATFCFCHVALPPFADAPVSIPPKYFETRIFNSSKLFETSIQQFFGFFSSLFRFSFTDPFYFLAPNFSAAILDSGVML